MLGTLLSNVEYGSEQESENSLAPRTLYEDVKSLGPGNFHSLVKDLKNTKEIYDKIK